MVRPSIVTTLDHAVRPPADTALSVSRLIFFVSQEDHQRSCSQRKERRALFGVASCSCLMARKGEDDGSVAEVAYLGDRTLHSTQEGAYELLYNDLAERESIRSFQSKMQGSKTGTNPEAFPAMSRDV